MSKKFLYNCSFSESPNDDIENFQGVSMKKIKKELKKRLKEFKKCEFHDRHTICIVKLNPIKKSKQKRVSE